MINFDCEREIVRERRREERNVTTNQPCGRRKHIINRDMHHIMPMPLIVLLYEGPAHDHPSHQIRETQEIKEENICDSCSWNVNQA